jgi:GT2 family glycosyltransferase
VARVAINIVTYNSAKVIDRCLESVLRQKYRNFVVTVLDNHSTDDTLARLARWRDFGARIILLSENLYYARAHNIGIQETQSDYVLTLNPDVVIRPDYLSHVVAAFDRSNTIGSVNGKLLLAETVPSGEGGMASAGTTPPLIDGAGLMMLKSRRPYLRGNRKPSDTSCLQPQYIFGADGAAAAYRRSMLEDVAIDGEYFDAEFVMYREDVDLAWRAQLYGWDTYYTPEAVGYHVRGFHLNQSRRQVPPYIKRQSVKNGWLLVIKNDTPGALFRDGFAFLPYQARILAGILTIEHSSLPAMVNVLKLMPSMWRKRTEIRRKRRRSEEAMRRWFE